LTLFGWTKGELVFWSWCVVCMKFSFGGKISLWRVPLLSG